MNSQQARHIAVAPIPQPRRQPRNQLRSQLQFQPWSFIINNIIMAINEYKPNCSKIEEISSRFNYLNFSSTDVHTTFKDVLISSYDIFFQSSRLAINGSNDGGPELTHQLMLMQRKIIILHNNTESAVVSQLYSFINFLLLRQQQQFLLWLYIWKEFWLYLVQCT